MIEFKKRLNYYFKDLDVKSIVLTPVSIEKRDDCIRIVFSNNINSSARLEYVNFSDCKWIKYKLYNIGIIFKTDHGELFVKLNKNNKVDKSNEEITPSFMIYNT